jgi:hypothetical protein
MMPAGLWGIRVTYQFTDGGISLPRFRFADTANCSVIGRARTCDGPLRKGSRNARLGARSNH